MIESGSTVERSATRIPRDCVVKSSRSHSIANLRSPGSPVFQRVSGKSISKMSSVTRTTRGVRGGFEMADKNRWCVQCGETGNAGMGAVGLYKSGGAGTVRNVHAMCGRRALEFATAGGVSEVMLLTWPTNRIDEERHVSGPEVLKALAKYIAEMDEEQVAAHGGVEARLLECTQGIILPHVLRDGTSGPASCLAVEWDELVAEARLIWHEQVQEREALRAVEGGGV